MRIYWADLLKSYREDKDENHWLAREIFNSVPKNVPEQASDKKYYDVELIIDGVTCEPKWLNHVINNIVKYIEEAKALALEKFEEAMRQGNVLLEIIDEAENKIKEAFNLYKNEEN